MRYKSPTGYFCYYIPTAEEYPDYEDVYRDDGAVKSIRGDMSYSVEQAEREHESVLEILERTKIVRVYDGNGKLIGEQIDASVQHLIDRENAAYRKEQERREREAKEKKQKARQEREAEREQARRCHEYILSKWGGMIG